MGFSVAALAQEASDEAAAQPSAETEAAPQPEEGGTRVGLGMSILGNEEAPKALVIVPWKSSQIGDGLGVSNSMDDRPTPVDREVFMREVRYYELRSGRDED
jgi:hypothetical protein